IGLPDVADRNILLLDDILDSGHTLAAIREKLKTANPRSIRICVLLSKKKERSRQVDADYVGFEIEDEFVVGYGLDFMEQYRNLPYIGVLRRKLLAQLTWSHADESSGPVLLAFARPSRRVWVTERCSGRSCGGGATGEN